MVKILTSRHHIVRKAWKVLKAAGLISGFCLCGLLLLFLYAFLDLPSVEPLRTEAGLKSLFQWDEERAAQLVLVPVHELPPHANNAFIAASDSADVTVAYYGSNSFAAHAGDLLLNARNYATGKRTDHADRAFLQLKIMLFLNREEITAVELATAYFGQNAYGISAASQTYYDKPLSELNLCEAAMLASLPQSPAFYSPINYPERAKERQRYVLSEMARLGLASDADLAACK